MIDNLALLRSYIADAPIETAEITEGIYVIGANGKGYEICASCMLRIHGRGSWLPDGFELIWSDSGRIVNCDLSEFHKG